MATKIILQVVMCSMLTLPFFTRAMESSSESILLLNARVESASFYDNNKLVFSLKTIKGDEDFFIFDMDKQEVESLGCRDNYTQSLIPFERRSCLVRLRLDGQLDRIDLAKKSIEKLSISRSGYSFAFTNLMHDELACITDDGYLVLFDAKKRFRHFYRHDLLESSQKGPDQKRATLRAAAVFWQQANQKKQCGAVYVTQQEPSTIAVFLPSGAIRKIQYKGLPPIVNVQVTAEGSTILAQHQDDAQKKNILSLTRKGKGFATTSNPHKKSPLLVDNTFIMGAMYDARTLVLCGVSSPFKVDAQFPLAGDDAPIAVSPDRTLLVTKNSDSTTIRRFLEKK
jgi:hypothetical protein